MANAKNQIKKILTVLLYREGQFLAKIDKKYEV